MQPMFQIPLGFPLMNMGQNYVNNINFTQNFNHFNNYPGSHGILHLNPYQMHPLPFGYPPVNNMMIPPSQHIMHQPIKQHIIIPPPEPLPLPNLPDPLPDKIILKKKESNLETGKKFVSVETVKKSTDKKEENKKTSATNTTQKPEEMLRNPTLSYIYGGHVIDFVKF